MQLNVANVFCLLALLVIQHSANAQTVLSHPDPKEKIENLIELRPMKPTPPPPPGVQFVSIPIIHPPTNPTAQTSSESFPCYRFSFKFVRDLQAKNLTVEITNTVKDSPQFNQVAQYDLSESELNQLLNNRRAFLKPVYKCHDNRLGIHLIGFEWQPETQQTHEVWYSTILLFDGGKMGTLTRTILD